MATVVMECVVTTSRFVLKLQLCSSLTRATAEFDIHSQHLTHCQAWGTALMANRNSARTTL